MEDNTRIPPHSVEAEQSVLGSILLDKDAMISVSETLIPPLQQLLQLLSKRLIPH